MDEEDPVDTMPKIEDECRPQCSKKWVDYEACVARLKDDKTGEAHCTGQYLDFYACLQSCAVPRVFKTLNSALHHNIDGARGWTTSHQLPGAARTTALLSEAIVGPQDAIPATVDMVRLGPADTNLRLPE